MQLKNSRTPKASKALQTRVCTSVRAAADAGLIRKSGNMYKVRLDRIREEEGFNPRDYDSPECQAQILQFKADYKAGRYVPPPEIRWEGEFAIVVEGHQRGRAARLARDEGAPIEEIICLEFQGTKFERDARLLKAAEGVRFKPLETAAVLARMKRENPDRTNADIAAETARSVQAVEQSLVLDSASDEVKAMVRAGEVEAQAAITLVRQHGPHAEHALKEMLQRIRNDIAARAPAEDAANDSVADGTAKPRKAKPAKVTVRAMRELKVKQATLSAEHASEVAVTLNEFAGEIGGETLLEELCALDAANDDLYTLDIEAPLLRRLMNAWALLRPLLAQKTA
jgi:hypothetical protein